MRGRSYTLGYSGPGHDLAFALVNNATATLEWVGEEERFSRIRHSVGGLPTNSALMAGLDELGIVEDNVRSVAIAYEPALIPSRGGEALQSLDGLLLARWGFGAASRFYYAHHLAHAASTFIPSGYSTAAALVLDGRGERCTMSIWTGRGSKLRLEWQDEAASLGLLYLATTEWLGLGTLGDEGKTMGLAPYGDPSLLPVFERRIIQWSEEDGTHHISPLLTRTDYSVAALEVALGPRRRDDEPLSEFHKDVAATVQFIAERVLLGLARRARDITGIPRLCLAGGVALNSVANGVLEDSGDLEALYIPPWASDVGVPIGAALYHAVQDRPGSRAWGSVSISPFLGRSVKKCGVAKVVNDVRVNATRVADVSASAAEAIAAGKVVGWFQGRSEIGPRALGNRSILANPRMSEMASIVNNKVKFREPWRPFAPAILLEDVGRYFETADPAPYMVVVRRFREEFRSLFPSVTHVDGSARLQTVSDAENPLFAALLRNVRSLTGHAVVLNTSLNLKGEPIANSEQDAVQVLLASAMDELYLDAFRLRPSYEASERSRGPKHLALDSLAALLVSTNAPGATVIVFASSLSHDRDAEDPLRAGAFGEFCNANGLSIDLILTDMPVADLPTWPSLAAIDVVTSRPEHMGSLTRGITFVLSPPGPAYFVLRRELRAFRAIEPSRDAFLVMFPHSAAPLSQVSDLSAPWLA